MKQLLYRPYPSQAHVMPKHIMATYSMCDNVYKNDRLKDTATRVVILGAPFDLKSSVITKKLQKKFSDIVWHANMSSLFHKDTRILNGVCQIWGKIPPVHKELCMGFRYEGQTPYCFKCTERGHISTACPSNEAAHSLLQSLLQL